MIPDENAEPDSEENFIDDESDASGSENPDHPKRRRMRVKIRKKIRIKQKPSAKKWSGKLLNGLSGLSLSLVSLPA